MSAGSAFFNGPRNDFAASVAWAKTPKSNTESSSNYTIYIIIAVLVIAVLIISYMKMGGKNDKDPQNNGVVYVAPVPGAH